jgi:RNA polymerase primary sigma factor
MASGLAWYLDEIGRHPLLTPAEEIELGAAVQRWLTHPEPVPPGIRRRGQRAKDRFVTANLRLAVGYVSKRCNRLLKQHSTDDLIQAANIGLIKAVERFDPTRGYRFSTYAYWWIRQGIAAYCAQHGRVIAIPGSHSEHLGRLQPTAQRLKQQLGREPTAQELAEGLGVSQAVFEQLLINARPVQSLDMLVGDELELGDVIAAHDPSLEDQEQQQERWRQAEELRQLLARLPADDQRLISDAYDLDHKQLSRQQLAAEHGCSVATLSRRLAVIRAQLATMDQQLVLLVVEPSAPIAAMPQRIRRRRSSRVEQLSLWPADQPPWLHAQPLAA